MGVGGGPSGRPDVQLLRKQERNIMWPEERSGLRRGEWWWKSSERMLPRVGSLHYLCGHCGHAGHSLLVRGGIKPRSSHNILEPTADLRSREKPSRPKSLHSSFETLNVRIKVTRAVMRESGQFDNGCSVYDNIAVRDGQDSNGSWQYTERISQDCPMETSWKRSSPDIVTDTEQREENRRPRLKMFKLKCLDKVASF